MSEREPPLPPAGGFGAGAPPGQAPYAHGPAGGGGAGNAIGIVLGVVVGVVVVLGLLSTLAIRGMRKYIAAAKTAEATNTVQAIGRGAAAAYERDGKLCPTVAHPIPSSPESIRGRKYMAGPTEWRDAGFDCLRFEMSLPQYYTYEYRSRGDTFEVIARGDLNGDGVLSTHVLRGRVENGAVVMAPSIEVTDPEE